jgi:hypothetical protein
MALLWLLSIGSEVTKKLDYVITQTGVYLILAFDIVFAGAYARIRWICSGERPEYHIYNINVFAKIIKWFLYYLNKSSDRNCIGTFFISYIQLLFTNPQSIF